MMMVKKEGGVANVLGLTPTKLTFILLALISTTMLILLMMYYNASQTSNSSSAAATLLASFLPQTYFHTFSPTVVEDNEESLKSKEGEASVLVSSVNPANTSSVVGIKEEQNFTNQLNKGDERRPFYSGAKCKKWLSKMWACRFTQRTDFAFEKFRWQPKDCQMEDFQGSKFLQRMRNKTLAFIGDSLARQQYQSLMCMIVGEDEARPHHVIDVGHEYGLIKASVRPDGWAYRFPSTNTTIIFYWSVCLCDLVRLKPSNPKSKVAMHLDRPPQFLQRFLFRFDVLVLSTGHHWNRVKFKTNRWVMHVGGVRVVIPNTNNKKDALQIGGALNFTINSIIKWVDSRLVQHSNLKAFYRSISPRHFFNGEWYNGGSCSNTIPLSRGDEVVKFEPNDLVAAKAVQGTNVKLLDITALSELRDEGHVSKYGIRAKPGVQDCLHWCLPGIPDAWNEILFAQL